MQRIALKNEYQETDDQLHKEFTDKANRLKETEKDRKDQVASAGMWLHEKAGTSQSINGI